MRCDWLHFTVMQSYCDRTYLHETTSYAMCGVV